MSRSLHGWFDPQALGESGARLEGEIPLSKLPRLKDMLAADAGRVGVSLVFSRPSAGPVLVDLTVEGDLDLVCQRCMGPFAFRVKEQACLALLETDHASQLAPEGYEPYEMPEARINPAILVEDELIIALPLAPRHASQAQCDGADPI